jgi:lipase ATG15
MVRNIWLTGHSLGGGLAAMLGLAFDLPTVTFQSPGDLLAAQRLHLPLPEEDKLKDLPIWHFGHTADPIFMGKCNGVLSSCYIAGYALETGCHTGNACIYDTVKDFKWSPDIRRHRLGVVIDEVLSVYNDTAECMPQTNCTDCSAWNYLEE